MSEKEGPTHRCYGGKVLRCGDCQYKYKELWMKGKRNEYQFFCKDPKVVHNPIKGCLIGFTDTVPEWCQYIKNEKNFSQLNIFKIKIDGRVPSKKNSYEIRFNMAFWRAIRAIVERFKRSNRRLYWIGPSKQVKDYEQYAGWMIFSECRQEIKGEVVVKVRVENKGRLPDTDNLTGCLGDALQLGLKRFGFNDRQIRRWEIERVRGNKDCILMEVYGVDV